MNELYYNVIYIMDEKIVDWFKWGYVNLSEDGNIGVFYLLKFFVIFKLIKFFFVFKGKLY